MKKYLTGKKFGKLNVIKPAGVFTQPNGNKYIKWLCKCDCGNYTVVKASSLINGSTKSCGCLRHETKTNLQHGESKTRLYKVWTNMKQRCQNNKNPEYSSYGGRGINVCEEWKIDFNAFSDWAKRNGYSDDLTIERIDIDGNYCPENCSWIKKEEQQLNKTNSRKIFFDGKNLCLCEWSKIYHVPQPTIHHRLLVGWDVKDAITKPSRKMTRKGEKL